MKNKGLSKTHDFCNKNQCQMAKFATLNAFLELLREKTDKFTNRRAKIMIMIHLQFTIKHERQKHEIHCNYHFATFKS